MTRPIRLLIADDHPVVRDGLRAMLSTQPDLEVIAEATTGTEAVARARALRPDVVLMDLQMPQLDGADAIAALRSYESDVHVLVLTTYDTDADITRAIDAGATGYLLKDAPRDQLVRRHPLGGQRRIRAVAVGGQPGPRPDACARRGGPQPARNRHPERGRSRAQQQGHRPPAAHQ